MLTLRSVGPAVADGPTLTSPVTPLLVDRREAARLLSLSERTIFTLTKSGQLPSKRIGRNVRYCPVDLVAWLSQTTSVATSTV